MKKVQLVIIDIGDSLNNIRFVTSTPSSTIRELAKYVRANWDEEEMGEMKNFDTNESFIDHYFKEEFNTGKYFIYEVPFFTRKRIK